ncbi:MAG: hypothetical protein EBE86_015150 [Hormoscilla sp. GUM202]|nr:hypothetical protein [Hormoscilla sp. GUM202]
MEPTIFFPSIQRDDLSTEFAVLHQLVKRAIWPQLAINRVSIITSGLYPRWKKETKVMVLPDGRSRAC